MYLSSNIRYLRKKMGLNQVAFADLIGAKRNTISDYERERSNPSLELIQKMSSLFEVNLGDLIEKDLSQYPTKNTKNDATFEGNKVEEEVATYQTKTNDSIYESLLLDISEEKRVLIHTYIKDLLSELQKAKRDNQNKDTEIYYLKNLIEAKEQSIQNLKKMISLLENR